jgi:phosphonate degradation associated HDIG domain protein
VSPSIQSIVETYANRGNERYGSENVTQLQHALQCAQLAVEEEAPASLVAAALLHDLGHILQPGDLPHGCDTNLDDHHETRAYELLLETFGAEVADPVRLHVVAKRYLCTKQPDYANRLSPTSHKSYLDQGGEMNATELARFEAEPFFREALRLRKWDDTGKDREGVTPPLEAFVPYLEACVR